MVAQAALFLSLIFQVHPHDLYKSKNDFRYNEKRISLRTLRLLSN